MKKVVILGGGFGGVRTALLLRKKVKDVEIELVDRNSYHTYTPSLYEVATAYKGGLLIAKDISENKFKSKIGGVISFPFSDFFEKNNITSIRSNIGKINGAQDKVILDDGSYLKYDYLVVALGSMSNYFGVLGAEKYCLPIKTLSDALNIRDKVRAVFLESKKSRKKISITVIGAGLSGFEVVTEMVMFARKLKDYYSMQDVDVEINLVEATDRILASCCDEFWDKANNRLKKLGINVFLNQRITKVSSKRLHFGDNDFLETDIAIWSCGVLGSPVLADSKGIGELNKINQVVVSEYLSSKEKNNIFVVGDCVSFSYKDNKAPQTAWAAEQEANTVAYNLYAILKGKTPKKHKVKMLGFVASGGGKFAVVEVWDKVISGFLGWVIKRLVDLKYLLTLYNPYSAFVIWVRGVSLFGKND